MTESIYEVIDNGYIKRTDADGKQWFIPNDPANFDYQAYLDKDKPKAALSTPMVLTYDNSTPPDTIQTPQPDEADLTEGTH